MYEVTTCGITSDDTIKVNLAKEIPELEQHYDVVLHACGKAHVVPKTEVEKQAFLMLTIQVQSIYAMHLRRWECLMPLFSSVLWLYMVASLVN